MKVENIAVRPPPGGGIISAETMAYPESEEIPYILGARMRRQRRVRRRSSLVPAVTGRFTRKELDRRLEKAGHCFEWADINRISRPFFGNH